MKPQDSTPPTNSAEAEDSTKDNDMPKTSPNKPSPSPAIYQVTGSKGGVGKSMTTLALVDYLLSKSHAVLLVETDTSNPDTSRCLAESADVVTVACQLDEVDGWIRLIDSISEHPDRTVVINCASRTDQAVTQYGAMLVEAANELQRKLITLWVINRQRNSIEQLITHLERFPGLELHVVRNGWFGDKAKFQIYNDSQARRSVEAAGGCSLVLPDLADRVADDLYSQCLSIAQAEATLTTGSRVELRRWRSAVHAELANAV